MRTHKGVDVPREIAAVLKADAEVLRVFESMRPSCQREYVQWVTEAKTEATRTRRLSSLLDRIREYGGRHPVRQSA
jgi:uncharacterized protein YdeI (YjbR/CyaY-like superfamily)